MRNGNSLFKFLHTAQQSAYVAVKPVKMVMGWYKRCAAKRVPTSSSVKRYQVRRLHPATIEVDSSHLSDHFPLHSTVRRCWRLNHISILLEFILRLYVFFSLLFRIILFTACIHFVILVKYVNKYEMEESISIVERRFKKKRTKKIPYEKKYEKIDECFQYRNLSGEPRS